MDKKLKLLETNADSIIAMAAAGMRQNCPINEADYKNADGFITCGSCNKPKERDVTIQAPEGMRVYKNMPCACDCDIRKIEKEWQKIEQRKIEDRRRLGIPDEAYRSFRFEIDDSPESENSLILQAYADKWEEMFSSNKGLLLNGTRGTGKSFYACCVANAVIDKGYSATVTTITKLQVELSDNAQKSNILYDISNVSLLVLDDFGTESKTDHAIAVTNLIIDTRSKSKKPLIITTNLTDEQIDDSKFTPERAADRIHEMCPWQLSFTGMSRRRYIAEKSRQEMYNLLAK